ncbi:MAG: protein kinase domain-containing protein, partial [Bradymonadaceae bacterium]
MYMTMELIDGMLLTEVVRQGLSLAHILELTDGLLAGLAHAHARGVIHRDLKPGNVLMAASQLPDRLGVAKIVDFGIATLLTEGGDGDTEHGEVVGTPRYMSPEQAAGDRQITPRADLYNVGLILYELVCGTPPFGHTKGLAVMSLHVHEAIPPMVPRQGIIMAPGLEAFVLRALEKNPIHRWSSAAEMRRELQEVWQSVQTDPRAFRPPHPLGEEELGAKHSTVEESVVVDAAEVPTAVDLPSVWQPPEVAGLDGVEGVASFQRIPFVGRPTERAWLMDIVERTRQVGRGNIVLVEGEAGLGKTRLTMWLKEHAEERGLLHGHIGAFTRGASGGLRGLQEVVDSLFGTRGLGRAQILERIRGRLESWGQVGATDAQPLTDFLRPDEHETGIRHAPSSPGALFAVLARTLEVAARRRPRLIILDDAHWAGTELGDFLDFLAVEMRHRPVPLLVMVTIRTEDLSLNPRLAAKLGALSRYVGETVERLALERLKRASGDELVRALLPVDEEL